MLCKREEIKANQTDPVSAMQKTGRTNYSTFLVWFGLERRLTVDVISRGQSTQQPFSCVLGHFRHGDEQ